MNECFDSFTPSIQGSFTFPVQCTELRGKRIQVRCPSKRPGSYEGMHQGGPTMFFDFCFLVSLHKSSIYFQAGSVAIPTITGTQRMFGESSRAWPYPLELRNIVVDRGSKAAVDGCTIQIKHNLTGTFNSLCLRAFFCAILECQSSTHLAEVSQSR